MYGSESLPLGPAGGFPKQRISDYGVEIVPPQDQEGRYAGSDISRLPAVEKDFNSSVRRVKSRVIDSQRRMRGGIDGVGANTEFFRGTMIAMKKMLKQAPHNIQGRRSLGNMRSFLADRMIQTRIQNLRRGRR